MSSPDSTGSAPEDLGGRSTAGPAVNELDEDHSSTSTLGPFLVGGFMLVVGLVLLQQTFKINAEGFDPLGPKFFPLIVICLWLLLSVLYLLQHTLRVVRHRTGLAAERFDHMLGAGALVVLLVVYAYVLDPLGYWIATSIFFVGSARAMGSRNLARDIVIGIGLALLVYLSFTRALNVHLPEGVLGL
ncbi:MAG TPA: tripartite tricarboxylate transporter TctB family protein [Nocardioidaceae bacterium]|nr:tripartite tricarboxylate transporter TctB family protein [Nocardioidaceae bacterium]